MAITKRRNFPSLFRVKNPNEPEAAQSMAPFERFICVPTTASSKRRDKASAG
jgi:hypothetical protein